MLVSAGSNRQQATSRWASSRSSASRSLISTTRVVCGGGTAGPMLFGRVCGVPFASSVMNVSSTEPW